jgi:hypothetical protein
MAKLTIGITDSVTNPAAGKFSIFWSSDFDMHVQTSSGTIYTYATNANTMAQVANKDFADATTTISNVSATSKAVKFSLSGMTAAVVLTIASSQSTSQTLTIPNITGPDTILTVGSTASQLANKDFSDASFTVSNVSSSSKAVKLSLSGMTASVVLTISSSQTTSQTLTIPNIAGADTLMTLALAQSVTGVKTMTNMTTLAGTNSVPSMTITNGVNLASATANAIENDGVSFYATMDTTNGRAAWMREHYFRTTGTTGITTIADVYGANSAIPLIANSFYEIEFAFHSIQSSAGGTYTLTLTTSTNTVTTRLDARYLTNPIAGLGTVGTPQTAGVIGATGTTLIQALPVTGLMAIANHTVKVFAFIAVGATGGNIRLRLTSSAGTATIQIGSYYRVKRMPAASTGTFAA